MGGQELPIAKNYKRDAGTQPQIAIAPRTSPRNIMQSDYSEEVVNQPVKESTVNVSLIFTNSMTFMNL